MNEKTPANSVKDSGSVPPGAQPIPMGYFVPVNPPDIQDEISVLDWLHVFAKHKRMIIVVAFVCAAIAGAISFVMTPIYRADVLLVPAQSADEPDGLQAMVSRYGGLADLAGISMPRGGGVDISLTILQSRRLITSFVSEQKIKPILFEERWDKQAAAWVDKSQFPLSFLKSFFTSENQAGRTNDLAPGEPTLLETYERFTEEVIGVKKNVETGVVTVQIEWKDPDIAAAWANALVAQLNAEIRQSAIDDSERSIGYLKQQIEDTSLAGLQSVMYRLIEEHTKNISLAMANDDYALKIIDPAVVPDKRIKPNRLLLILLGFIGGLLLGVLAAIRRDFIARSG